MATGRPAPGAPPSRIQTMKTALARFASECLALAIVGAAFGAPALYLLYL